MSKIKDSGNRREFDSGAVRDITEGKGRCDLLPLDVVGEMLNDDIISLIGAFQKSHNLNNITLAIKTFAVLYFNDHIDDPCYEPIYKMLREVAIHYEDGCAKYGERNWEKGIPIHCYIDSGVRHYLKFREGLTDERHDRAFVWNMLGLLWTWQNKPECIDI